MRETETVKKQKSSPSKAKVSNHSVELVQTQRWASFENLSFCQISVTLYPIFTRAQRKILGVFWF